MVTRRRSYHVTCTSSPVLTSLRLDSLKLITPILSPIFNILFETTAVEISVLVIVICYLAMLRAGLEALSAF